MRQLLNNAGARPSRIVTGRVVDVLSFPHTCDLWKPAPLSVDANKRAKDPQYLQAFSAQKCRFVGTQETDEPGIVGRTKTVNIFTLDVWLFPVGVPIADTWVIKLTSPGDSTGRFWMVEGNPQSQEQNPYVLREVQKVLTKLCPAPQGVF